MVHIPNIAIEIDSLTMGTSIISVSFCKKTDTRLTIHWARGDCCSALG